MKDFAPLMYKVSQIQAGAVMTTPAETSIIAYLKAHGERGTRGCQLVEEICTRQKLLTYNSIYYVLRNMQAEGLIHKRGNTSGAVWYFGPDNENTRRNEVINHLLGLSEAMKKTATMLAEFSQDHADELRGAAMIAKNWADNLKKM